MIDVLEVAFAEEGYLEKSAAAYKADKSVLYKKTEGAGSGNYTKYWADLDKSYQGSYWCNAFVNWCFWKAYGERKAKELLCTDNGWSYYTPTSASYFKKHGQWHTSNPQVGDVIYFYGNTSEGLRIHHVGIVYAADNQYVYTIEGNTGGGSKVITNGGGVARKQHPLSYSGIAGYGRPNYSDCAGWTQKDGEWFYFCYGKAVKDTWWKVNGYWFNFDADGKMRSGWFKDGDNWYYLDENEATKGTMRTSKWIEKDGKWYYLTASGVMAAGCYVQSENKLKYYWIGSDGTWDTAKDTYNQDDLVGHEVVV